MSRGSPSPHEDPLKTPSLPDFKLAEKLGQGAFGSVYRALNWTTGETCAVKQIDLSHIPRSELPDIMQEIDLLKNLHHSNIVQYRGYARTDSALYIVLEYCENGSLSAIIKKFGRFPESLVGLYVLQVLQGLLYLHDQGVIHRDIKGSNILATKEGTIKLADFGVATRVGGPSDSAVVGSPYWMAPEVVDQSGATPASDIWSLGALVIELLTGKPPYHFLDPMPALFRIVNDDCPPLPEGASAVVRDFLTQCFQKDGNLRIGARKLLRHPWMLVAKKQQEAQGLDRERRRGRPLTEAENGRAGEESTRPISLYDDSMQQVQEWNKALKGAPTTNIQRNAGLLSASLAKENAPVLLRQQPEISTERALSDQPLPNKTAHHNATLPLSLIQPKEGSRRRKKMMLGRTADGLSLDREDVGDEESDDWDRDFEGGLSMSKIEALDRDFPDGSASVSDEAHDSDSDDDSTSTNSLTIKPTPRKAASMPVVGLETVCEDYSDLAVEDQSGPFEAKIDSFKVTIAKIIHNRSAPRVLRANAPLSSSKCKQKTQSGRPLLRPSFSAEALGPNPGTSRTKVTGSAPSLSSFAETDVDDYTDVFSDRNDHATSKLGSLQLQNHLTSTSWLGDEDSDDEDPFSSVSDTTLAFQADEHNLEANLIRDQLARQCASVGEMLDVVEGGNLDDYEVQEATLEITGLLEASQDARNHFKKRHGTLIIVEALQIARSREMIGILLRIVNLIVDSDAVELEKLALVGGCPVVMSFASKRYSREIRLETALFIGKLCRTSLLTLQMFVSCRGLRTLVDMLDEDYAEGRDLIWMAVDGLARVFEMNGPTPRNDFCRLLAQEGLLEPLTSALVGVCGDDDDLAESAKAKIFNILLLFAQSDHKVKQALATRANSLRLVKVASSLQPELLVILLKTIKNLSMLPGALDTLQNANAIEKLVEISSWTFPGRVGAEIQNHSLHTLFNLCRLSKSRQEEAASFGAIPILQKVVVDNSPLKQFALPILYDFAHLDSRLTRKSLWQHDGLSFYLRLLSTDTYSINAALEAVLAWLQDEPTRVGDCLLEPEAVHSLVTLFCSTKGTVFETMLDPYHRILRTSPQLTGRLATQSGFCKRIVERVERSTKAVVRLNLLRIAKTVFDSLVDRRDRERVVKLFTPAIARIAIEEKTVLASQLAKALSAEFVTVKDSTRKNLVPRRANGFAVVDGANSSSPVADATPSSQTHNLPPPEVARNIPCRFFPLGTCKYGEQCIFSHGIPGVAGSPGVPASPSVQPQIAPGQGQPSPVEVQQQSAHGRNNHGQQQQHQVQQPHYPHLHPQMMDQQQQQVVHSSMEHAYMQGMPMYYPEQAHQYGFQPPFSPEQGYYHHFVPPPFQAYPQHFQQYAAPHAYYAPPPPPPAVASPLSAVSVHPSHPSPTVDTPVTSSPAPSPSQDAPPTSAPALPSAEVSDVAHPRDATTSSPPPALGPDGVPLPRAPASLHTFFQTSAPMLPSSTSPVPVSTTSPVPGTSSPLPPAASPNGFVKALPGRLAGPRRSLVGVPPSVVYPQGPSGGGVKPRRSFGGSRPPCSFFEANRCKNGDECSFVHLLPDGTDARALGRGMIGSDGRTDSPEASGGTPPAWLINQKALRFAGGNGAGMKKQLEGGMATMNGAGGYAYRERGPRVVGGRNRYEEEQHARSQVAEGQMPPAALLAHAQSSLAGRVPPGGGLVAAINDLTRRIPPVHSVTTHDQSSSALPPSTLETPSQSRSSSQQRIPTVDEFPALGSPAAPLSPAVEKEAFTTTVESTLAPKEDDSDKKEQAPMSPTAENEGFVMVSHEDAAPPATTLPASATKTAEPAAEVETASAVVPTPASAPSAAPSPAANPARPAQPPKFTMSFASIAKAASSASVQPEKTKPKSNPTTTSSKAVEAKAAPEITKSESKGPTKPVEEDEEDGFVVKTSKKSKKVKTPAQVSVKA
ncbi:hypothetical protein JCM11491_007060 [Sporobolomyces phaffii]